MYKKSSITVGYAIRTAESEGKVCAMYKKIAENESKVCAG